MPAMYFSGTKPVPKESHSNVPQELADLVSRLVLEKFCELTDNLTSPYARRKVLSGIVMTTSDNAENATVISVSTGTKCINGEYMSDQGLAVKRLSRRGHRSKVTDEIPVLSARKALIWESTRKGVLNIPGKGRRWLYAETQHSLSPVHQYVPVRWLKNFLSSWSSSGGGGWR